MRKTKVIRKLLMRRLRRMQDGTRIVCKNLPSRLAMGKEARGVLRTDGGTGRWIVFDQEPEFRVLLGALTADVVVELDASHGMPHSSAVPSQELEAVM